MNAAGYGSDGLYVGTPSQQEALLWHDQLGDAGLADEAGVLIAKFNYARAAVALDSDDDEARVRMDAANAALQSVFARAAKLALN